jgi:myo-inositol-1(or 4)-monophosphatase
MPSFLPPAIAAARAAGKLLKDNYESDLVVGELGQYDIKLDLDVRSQQLIAGMLLAGFPDHMVLGEEGNAGNAASAFQWIVDPLDGTVNYFYGIPHFCVSIALRHGHEIVLGVIYDPMMDELFAVEKGGTPERNGHPIRVSTRHRLADAVITVGLSKSTESITAGAERYQRLVHQVRKTRMLGSAALAMAYVACGRLDAYIESSINLWDVAAGWLMVEAAGGSVETTAGPDPALGRFSIVASNGRLGDLA